MQTSKLWPFSVPFALVFLFAQTCFSIQAQQTPPGPSDPPPTAAERSLTEQTGADPVGEKSQDCLNGYTATMCTGENTKFLGAFDIVCLIAIPGLSAFVVPLLLGRARFRFWWMTYHVRRWLFPMLAGLALAGAVLLAVPFIPQMSPVRLESGLLRTLGVDPAFVDNCTPCRTRVTNRSPLYNLLPTGMPTQGLAPEYPYVLAGSVVAAFFLWSSLYWAVYFVWRTLRGLPSRKETIHA